MPWKDQLKRLKNEWNNLTAEPQQQQQQQQQPQQGWSQGPPPPQQGWSQPPPPQQAISSQPQIYWQPRFHPGAAVFDEWDPDTGNGTDGWGNQELEHYTAKPENAF